MRIVIDYDNDPDFSFCDEGAWDCSVCGGHNDSGVVCATPRCGQARLVALCTMLIDDAGNVVESLSNSVFLADADDWTTGSFGSVEEIPARCLHLREVAADLVAEYGSSVMAPPADPLRDLVRSVLAYDRILNDPTSDGTGTDARSPDGDDYNQLYGMVRLAAERAGIAWEA